MTPTECFQRFVAAFIAAWPVGDAASLAAFFSEDAVYHNGPLEPVTGREVIQATLAGFMAMAGRVDVDMIHMVADGPIVMTERVDHFHTKEGTISLPVMGVLEVRDGLITAWRDYFDLSQFTSQLPGQAPAG
jgi:limonene-1,2-epoxide hydrolase